MPRLIHDIGYLGLVFRIAQYKTVVLAGGVKPLEERSMLQR